MSLTLTLHVHAEDHAEALHETQLLARFNPRVLLAAHPLRFDRQEQVPPSEYGQRLLAALGHAKPSVLQTLALNPLTCLAPNTPVAHTSGKHASACVSYLAPNTPVAHTYADIC